MELTFPSRDTEPARFSEAAITSASSKLYNSELAAGILAGKAGYHCDCAPMDG